MAVTLLINYGQVTVIIVVLCIICFHGRLFWTLFSSIALHDGILILVLKLKANISHYNFI